MNNNNWDGIYGQESVKKILNQLINTDKIPHAFLFTGLEGTGKDLLSVRFAQLLNSKFVGNDQSDRINRLISEYSEPYVKFIFPLMRGKNETESSGPLEKLSSEDFGLVQEELQKKINNPYYKISIPRAFNIKISSIRDIKKFLSLSYSDIKYRLIIVSRAHLMNEEAQNALLKSLEEPPEGVLFILTTPFPSLLRETIISRCRIINFQPLNSSNIKEILIRYYKLEGNVAGKIASFAGGSVTNAVRLMENDFENLLEKTVIVLRYSFAKKYYSALNEFTPFLKENNTEAIKLLINMIIIWLNDIQKYRLGFKDFYFTGYVETLEKFTKRFPDVNINNTVVKLEFLSSLIQNNINLNILVLNLVYELSALIHPLLTG